jgi:hypothetical protein
MLENLSTIDWTSIQHAFGTAGDIPALLHALLSPQQAERQQAIEELDNLIYHQGTLYEATVYVAPFLVELLETPKTPDKENIVALFANLTYKSPEDCSGRERQWAQALHIIVERNINLLYPYLEANEPTVRWIIAYTLALFPQHRSISLPLLERAFSLERQSDVKEGIGEAIVKLQCTLGALTDRVKIRSLG